MSGDDASERVDGGAVVPEDPGRLRDQAARQRDTAAGERDSRSAARDEAAGIRDHAAQRAQERPSEADASGAGGDTGALSANRDRADRDRADRDRAGRDRADRDRADRDRADGGDRAHADRFRAHVDRVAAANDRADAATDRQHALADRMAAARERRAASLDGLTGAYHRQAGLVELDRDVARAARSGRLLVIAFLDVDNLKAINDVQGHAAGDRALIAVASTLTQAMRPYDLVIRYGGDEFICAAEGVDLAAARLRFDRVNEVLGSAMPGLALTAGLAQLRAGESSAGVISRADADLYEQRRHRSHPESP